MSILIGGQSFHHVDPHFSGVRVRALDKYAGHRRDEILPLAADLVNFMGGIGEDPINDADLLVGGAVYHPQQALFEENG